MNTIPRDGVLIDVEGIGLQVVYDLGDGVRIHYDFSWPGVRDQVDLSNWGIIHVSADDFGDGKNMGWEGDFRGLIHGGMVQELFPLGQQNLGYGQWFRQQTEKYGAGDWVTDPDVRSLYVEFLANPDKISEQELTARIKLTPYWKSKTTGQLAYNDLSPADQARLDADQAAGLVESWFRFTGENIAPTDPRLIEWGHQIASGSTTMNIVVEQFIKPQAQQNPESPWSRTLRDEAIAQQGFGVDVENLAAQTRQQYERWGVQASTDTYRQWGQELAMKVKSEADLEEHLRTQASILYPWKDPNLATRDAAEPWMQTYARVLERPAPSLFDPMVQQALSVGQPVFEFEKQLKNTAAWETTKNYQDQMVGALTDVGKLWGFV